MTNRLPTWLVSLLIVIAVALGLAWWVYQATQPPALTTPPPTASSASPLSSPVIDSLKQRTLSGGIPLTDTSPYTRTDPFAKP